MHKKSVGKRKIHSIHSNTHKHTHTHNVIISIRLIWWPSPSPSIPPPCYSHAMYMYSLFILSFGSSLAITSNARGSMLVSFLVSGQLYYIVSLRLNSMFLFVVMCSRDIEDAECHDQCGEEHEWKSPVFFYVIQIVYAYDQMKYETLLIDEK